MARVFSVEYNAEIEVDVVTFISDPNWRFWIRRDMHLHVQRMFFDDRVGDWDTTVPEKEIDSLFKKLAAMRRASLTPIQYEMAKKCANAYHAKTWYAYTNEMDVLCVVCDFDNDDYRDGFMCVDGVWIEFTP